MIYTTPAGHPSLNDVSVGASAGLRLREYRQVTARNIPLVVRKYPLKPVNACWRMNTAVHTQKISVFLFQVSS
jgi:hypothetical protein